MCRVLGVSESGYYRYIGNKDKPGKDEILSVAMKEILDEDPLNDNYGAPRMQLALNQRGIKAGKRRITRIMRENGWLHTPKRRPKGLTKADPEAMITENLIKQDFSSDAPFEKLLTDITQISNMKKELCIDTVKALRKYPVSGAILHSDRGSQYTSEAFRETLRKMNLYQSLSGVAHCYDNARMESFFATLKKELLYRIPTYRMATEEVKSAVFRYVFTYYNRTRVYTRNPFGLPPVVYRRQYKKQIA